MTGEQAYNAYSAARREKYGWPLYAWGAIDPVFQAAWEAWAGGYIESAFCTPFYVMYPDCLPKRDL